MRANQSQAFVNILHFTSRGVGNLSGGKFLPQKVLILIVFTQNYAIFPKFAQISSFFSKICANFDNFSQKVVNLDYFYLNGGKLF